MWPDRDSNQRSLDLQPDSLPTALGSPATAKTQNVINLFIYLFIFAMRFCETCATMQSVFTCYAVPK